MAVKQIVFNLFSRNGLNIIYYISAIVLHIRWIVKKPIIVSYQQCFRHFLEIHVFCLSECDCC